MWGSGRLRNVVVKDWGQARPGDIVTVLNGKVTVVRRGALRDRGEAVSMMQQRADCMRISALVLDAIREFFRMRRFWEVNTPNLAAAGGLEPHIDLFMPVHEGLSLISSPEFYMKRLLTGGEERIFQVTRAFRREPAGRMHNPEFTMLEFYRAGADYRDIMDDLEAMVRWVGRRVNVREVRMNGVSADLEGPWERRTVGQLLQADGRCTMEDDPDAINMVMADWDGLLGRDAPVFVYDYPATMASLAALDPDTGMAQRFELYIAGVEVANGFTELLDPDEQLDRFIHVLQQRRAEGLDLPAVDTRFIAALTEGMPPAGGVAVGLDRLVALLAHRDSIAQCLAFPWNVI